MRGFADATLPERQWRPPAASNISSSYADWRDLLCEFTGWWGAHVNVGRWSCSRAKRVCAAVDDQSLPEARSRVGAKGVASMAAAKMMARAVIGQATRPRDRAYVRTARRAAFAGIECSPTCRRTAASASSLPRRRLVTSPLAQIAPAITAAAAAARLPATPLLSFGRPTLRHGVWLPAWPWHSSSSRQRASHSS